RNDTEKKLTPKLQAQGLLAENQTTTDACAPFIALDECLASLHASHNLGIDFNCVRADVTGVHTNVDLSGCKGSVGDKAQNLTKSLHMLKPDADAKGQAKNAEKQAKDDLKDLGSKRRTSQRVRQNRNRAGVPSNGPALFCCRLKPAGITLQPYIFLVNWLHPI